MPIKRSAYKELRKAKRRHAANLEKNSKLKTSIKKFEKLLEDKKTDEAKAYFNTIVSIIDKASAKGILHKNNASRRKMRLAKRLRLLSKA